MRDLKCRYVTNNIPFLLIGPFKIEEIFKDPMIVIYHDVIYNKEIEMVKTIARPNLKRAKIFNGLLKKAEVASYRICKSAWIDDQNYRIINQISQRVEDMTGLDIRFSHKLQVVNYGIGGFYAPHFDITVVSVFLILIDEFLTLTYRPIYTIIQVFFVYYSL